jgi:hypothetical protein
LSISWPAKHNHFLFFYEQKATTREQNNRLTEAKGVIQMSSSQRKHYRDRDRYLLRMTPDQREAYLQRNREYK